MKFSQSKSGLLEELEEYMCQVLGNLRDLCHNQHENLGKQMAKLREESIHKSSNLYDSPRREINLSQIGSMI